MLRFIGSIFLISGSIGIGICMKNKMKEKLEALYQMQQIFKMLQGEITYSKASFPEACRRIADKTIDIYKEAFNKIYRDMLLNNGSSFEEIWRINMEDCLKMQSVAEEDKRVFRDFGRCAGYMDGQMQAEVIEQYMHRLDLSIRKMEEEMAGKVKVIMSLSIMSGLLTIIILI